MKRIAFFSPHMTLRGTEVVLYDFAAANEDILKNKSIVIYVKNHPLNNSNVVKKFSSRFGSNFIGIEVKGIENWPAIIPSMMSKVDNIIDKQKCDYFYIQKKGEIDGIESKYAKNLILCCGKCCSPHGHRYAYVSPWLQRVAGSNKFPLVFPPVENLNYTDEDLRTELSIPENGAVFSRTGGKDTWNLGWSNQVILEVLKHRSDAYFLFMNTQKFVEHPRVFFLEGTSDKILKTKFVNTSDAFLHCRAEGESFGSSIAEFSVRNKPVITFIHSPETNHIETLGDKGLYYHNPQTLFNVLMNFTPRPDLDWNAFKGYDILSAIKNFNLAFLDAG